MVGRQILNLATVVRVHPPQLMTLEIVYTWPSGREEVRYRRALGKLTSQEMSLRRKVIEQAVADQNAAALLYASVASWAVKNQPT